MQGWMYAFWLLDDICNLLYESFNLIGVLIFAATIQNEAYPFKALYSLLVLHILTCEIAAAE